MVVQFVTVENLNILQHHLLTEHSLEQSDNNWFWISAGHKSTVISSTTSYMRIDCGGSG